LAYLKTYHKTKKNCIDVVKENSFIYNVNLSTYLFSICQRKRHISEPLEMVLEKIRKEIEIKNYLKLKEDILIMKELLINEDENEIFNLPYDFEEFYFSINDTSIIKKKRGIENYLEKRD